MANTPETAAQAREMHPDYRSASCDDVAHAVDEQMSLRAEVERLQKSNSAWEYEVERCRQERDDAEAAYFFGEAKLAKVVAVLNESAAKAVRELRPDLAEQVCRTVDAALAAAKEK
jgi:hypothetical protein